MSGKSSAHAALSHRSSPLDSYSPKKTFVPLRMPRALNAMSLHTTEDSPGHDRFWKVIGASSALLQVPFATHRKQTHTHIYIYTHTKTQTQTHHSAWISCECFANLQPALITFMSACLQFAKGPGTHSRRPGTACLYALRRKDLVRVPPWSPLQQLSAQASRH